MALARTWGIRFVLKGCWTCGGDLVLQDGETQCLQCARYYYARRVLPPGPMKAQKVSQGGRFHALHL